MDLDEDAWVERLVTVTIENIVKELKDEKRPGEGAARSQSVESLVILSELPTYDEVFNGFQPSKSSSSTSASSDYFQGDDYGLFVCALNAAEVFAKSVYKKRMSRKEKETIMDKALVLTLEFKEYTEGRRFKASILPEVKEKSAAAKKLASFRTGVREHIRSFATFLRRKAGTKDAKKHVKNSGELSLVIYNSTGPDGRRRQTADTHVPSSKKRSCFSRFRSLLSRLCCCR